MISLEVLRRQTAFTRTLGFDDDCDCDYCDCDDCDCDDCDCDDCDLSEALDGFYTNFGF